MVKTHPRKTKIQELVQDEENFKQDAPVVNEDLLQMGKPVDPKATWLHVTMLNGKCYQIPAALIAEHYAKSLSQDKEEVKRIAENVLNDHLTLVDYATNAMTWDDVKNNAFQVFVEVFDLNKVWKLSPKEIKCSF